MTYHFGYWVFGGDMKKVNLENLKKNGTTDLFLNYYAFTVHGESTVAAWIEKAKGLGINVHIWMQCFYDGSWINPKTANLSAKISEAKKYANMKNVAGVHLDYLRYPGNAYKTSGGADAITNFVKQVKAAIPKGIILSCAVMPEADDKYYYGQDIEALGKIVDVIIPMQYKGNYNAGSSWLASTTKTFSSKASIWSGLQSYKSDDDTSLLSSDELLNDSKTCLDNGARGVLLFRYGLSQNIDFKKLGGTKVNTDSSGSMSKTISNKNGYALASGLKEYVEKNKKYPSSLKVDGVEYNGTEIAYIMSYMINNLKSNISIPGVKAPSSFSAGETIKEDILPGDFKDQAKRIIQYVTQNGQLPLYVTTVKSQKHASVQMFSFAFSKILVWYNNHNNTLPNYCTYDTTVFSGTATAVTSIPKSTKTKILNADVYTLARNVKASVEKNKKLESSFKIGDVTYTNTEVAYILSSAINNLKSDITIPSIKAPSTFSGGQAINEDIYPSDFKDQAKRIVNYVSKNGQLPVYVTSVKSQKQISVQMFSFAFSKTLVWYKDHSNTLPNYTTYDTRAFSTSTTNSTNTSSTTSNNCTNPYVSSPHYTTTGCNKLGQCTPYYCGPHSIHQALKKFGITDITEAQLASVAGTTSAGTDHEGLSTAVAWVAKKKGIKLDVEWKRFSELGATRNERFENAGKLACKPNKALLFHIGYEDSGSSKGDTVFGHYEMCDKFNIKTEYVRALNSLGSRSGNGYLGHLQDRSFNLQEHFINNISQKSVMVITKG